MVDFENISNLHYQLKTLMLTAMDNFAQRKKKYSRGNNMPFMNGTSKKFHMKRSCLINRYLRNRSGSYKKFFIKSINTRKTQTKKMLLTKSNFGGQYSLFYQTKIKSSEKFISVEEDKIITEGTENFNILNEYFSNAVKNLKISRFRTRYPLVDQISHPNFKAVLKFQNHPSVCAINNTVSGNDFHKYQLLRLWKKSIRLVQGSLS